MHSHPALYRFRRALAAGMIFLSFFALAACSPRVHKQGNELDAERVAKVETGKTNRDQVLEILGTPSSTSTFGPEVWYYISQRIHTTLFFRPEIDDRKVFAVAFDEDGVVSEVGELTLADGQNVRPVERTTPTAGHELTVLEQVFGNFGRFTRKPQKPQAGQGAPPR